MHERALGSSSIRQPATTTAWLLFPLSLPMSVAGAYITVTLLVDWKTAGASATVLTGLLAIGMAPLLLSAVLGPIADAALGPRRWWAIGVALNCAALGALIMLPFGPATLPAIAMLIFLARLAGYVARLGLDIITAATVAPHRKGAANTWMLSGGYAGLALGGGGGLWLHTHGATHGEAFAVIVAIAAVCSLALSRIGPDLRDVAGRGVAEGLALTFADLRAFVVTSDGVRLVVLCILPFGLGTASDLWPILADHWHAGAFAIGWIKGGPEEMATVGGIFLGGLLSDRGRPVRVLFAAALLDAALVIAIAAGPARPATMITGALAYAVLNGVSQVALLAVVYQLIGTRSAASKVSVCLLLYNVPEMVVTAADGWLGDRFGVGAILVTEAVLTFASLGVVLLLFPRILSRSGKDSPGQVMS